MFVLGRKQVVNRENKGMAKSNKYVCLRKLFI